MTSVMSNLRSVETERFITFGNGTKAKVEAVGDIVLKIPGSEVETVTLTNVFHVPDATMNLFSIRSPVKRGLEVVFSKDQSGEYCTMCKDGRLLTRTDARAGLFGMVGHSAHVALSAAESPELWHRRYGHLGYDNLAKLAAGELVTGMNISAAEFKAAGEKACGTCITSMNPSSTRCQDQHRRLTQRDLWNWCTQMSVDRWKFRLWVGACTWQPIWMTTASCPSSSLCSASQMFLK